MNPSRTHTYKGIQIVPCNCDRSRGESRMAWRLIEHHKSGAVWFEGQSAHYVSLDQAKDAIDDDQSYSRE